MPSKFILRDFRENSFYHVFNRGVDGRPIFVDPQDFRVFMFYLFVYLAEPEKVVLKFADVSARLRNHNLYKEVKMVSYCLMPNHFHLLLFQKNGNGVSNLMKQVMNGYTIYFNNKYKRTGALVQGRFKAVRVEKDELVLLLARFFHQNPVLAGICNKPDEYLWSSYKNLAGVDGEGDGFLEKSIILERFGSVDEFVGWHKDRIGYTVDQERIKHLLID